MDTWNVLFFTVSITFFLPLDEGLCDEKYLAALEQGTVLLYIWANGNVCPAQPCSAAFFPALCVKTHLCLVPELILMSTRNTICYLDPTNVVGSRNILILFIQDSCV